MQHQYEDKYHLVEFIANTAIAASYTCLEQFGLSEAQVRQLVAWSRQRSVSLRLSSTEKCTYVKEVTRKEDSKQQHVVESSLLGTFTSKVVTTIVEHYWQFDVDWQLSAYVGTGIQLISD